MNIRELYQLACRMERRVNNHTINLDAFFAWEKACDMCIRHAAMASVTYRFTDIRTARLAQETIYSIHTAQRAREYCQFVYRPLKGV